MKQPHDELGLANSGLLARCQKGLPVIGEKIFDFIDWLVLDLGKYIFEPLIGIDVVNLTASQQAIDLG